MSKNYSGDTTPIGPWSYFGHSILYSIPLIGWIFLVIQAIGAKNVNLRNYARSYFCILILSLIIFAIFLIITAATGGIEAIKNFFASWAIFASWANSK